MKRSEAFPSKYLSKDNISKPTVGIIASVTPETLGQGDDQETKPIVYFSSGIDKPMVCNTTNWMTIEDLYGDDSDNWVGKPIEVWVDPSVSFGGKRIGGLRFRAPSNLKETSGDLRAPLEVWSYAQAVTKCAEAGIPQEGLNAHLKEAGLTGYSASRDTATVQALIASVLDTEQPL